MYENIFFDYIYYNTLFIFIPINWTIKINCEKCNAFISSALRIKELETLRYNVASNQPPRVMRDRGRDVPHRILSISFCNFAQVRFCRIGRWWFTIRSVDSSWARVGYVGRRYKCHRSANGTSEHSIDITVYHCFLKLPGTPGTRAAAWFQNVNIVHVSISFAYLREVARLSIAIKTRFCNGKQFRACTFSRVFFADARHPVIGQREKENKTRAPPPSGVEWTPSQVEISFVFPALARSRNTHLSPRFFFFFFFIVVANIISANSRFSRGGFVIVHPRVREAWLVISFRYTCKVPIGR